MTIKNKENPYVSIIIPTYKRKKDLQKLITSISETEYNKKCLEIIVVDNAGTISDVDIKNHTRISLNIVKPKTNLYCSGGRRFGASIAKGNYLFFVDDDNILDKSCINYLVKELEVDNDIGVVGPIMLLFNDKKRIWSAGGIINKMGLPKYKFDGKNIDELNLPSVIRDIDFFPNAFMVRKELLSSINFDIKNFPHNWSEPDFCLRIKNSGKIVATITSAIEWHNIGYSGPLTRTNKLNIRDQAKSRILF